MNNKDKINILFICMGNICRSPTAEAVFRHYVESAGLSDHIRIDSAGTHDYHVGDPPDARAQRAAKQRGYDMSDLRGRQVDEDASLRATAIPRLDCSLNILGIMPSAKYPIRITGGLRALSACWT